MKRVAFLFRTDVHTADKSPPSWKGDYPAEVWSCLEQVGVLAKKHSVQAVLDGGDYFHLKAPSKNSHNLVVRTAEIHAAYPCPTYSIEGNHDIVHNDLASIERQPLGVLFASGVFKALRDEVFEHEGLRVRVVGMPYKLDRTLKELRAPQKRDGDDALIEIVHALAGKNPPDHVEDFFGEPVFRYDRLVSERGADVWAFGHWHRDQGIEEVQGKYFVNQGALSRGALVKENLERCPKVALIEVFEGGRVQVTPIPLKVAPADQVFDLEKKERRDREEKVIEQFAEHIQESVAVDVTEDIDSNMKSFEATGFDAEIVRLTREYLERARNA